MPQQAALDAIDRQAKELDAISAQVAESLNTVAGAERLAKWKAATTALLKQHAGDRIANQFALAKPGMSFTNDLVEEFQDEVETYRTALQAAKKAVRAQSPGASPA